MHKALFVGLLCSFVLANPVPKPATDLKDSSVPLIKLRQTPGLPRRDHLQPRAGAGTSEILDLAKDGTSFIAKVAFGKESFDLTLDTGSADLWVVSNKAVCTSNDCDFGHGYDQKSGNFVADGGSWSVTYGISGNTATDRGFTGNASVTIAGLTVTKQQIAVATSVASHLGYNLISGILGMGVSTSTGASPVMATFFREGVAAPRFALSLSRDASKTGNGGYLTLGGTPSGSIKEVNATGSFYSAPWEIAPGASVKGYTVTFSGIHYGKINGGTIVNPTRTQYTIDNGNPYLFMPTAEVDSIAQMYEPAATKSGSGYYVACTAKAPKLSFAIGGGLLPINPVDLIGGSIGSGFCSTPLYDIGTSASPTLGTPFLKNVLALFDWGNQQLSFASRPHYSS